MDKKFIIKSVLYLITGVAGSDVMQAKHTSSQEPAPEKLIVGAPWEAHLAGKLCKEFNGVKNIEFPLDEQDRSFSVTCNDGKTWEVERETPNN